jgi:Flp pilus assembly protein TadG
MRAPGRRAVASWAHNSDGVAMIEFALVLPILLIVITGIFDFGLAFREYLVVTDAAREGARMAVLPGYSDTDVTTRARAYLAAGGVPTARIQSVDVATSTATTEGGSTLTLKTVTASVLHQFSLIAPFGGNYGTIALTGVSVMRVEVAAEAP